MYTTLDSLNSVFDDFTMDASINLSVSSGIFTGGPLTTMGFVQLNDAGIGGEFVEHLALASAGTLMGGIVTGASASSGGGAANAVLVIFPDDGTLNAKAYDRVEQRAIQIQNQFDKQHVRELIGSSSIIACDKNALKETKKLILNNEKQDLINQLEALKQFKEKDNNQLKLKR